MRDSACGMVLFPMRDSVSKNSAFPRPSRLMRCGTAAGRCALYYVYRARPLMVPTRHVVGPAGGMRPEARLRQHRVTRLYLTHMCAMRPPRAPRSMKGKGWPSPAGSSYRRARHLPKGLDSSRGSARL